MVSYDYAFLSEHDRTDAKAKKREVGEPQETTKLLIGKDSKSTALFAHGIPCKGIHSSS